MDSVSYYCCTSCVCATDEASLLLLLDHVLQLLQIMDVCIVYTDACRLGLARCKRCVLLQMLPLIMILPGGGAKARGPSSSSVSGYTCTYSVAEPRQIVLYTNIWESLAITY